MKKLIYVTIFALSISLVFNCILLSENTEFRHIYQRCLSKISPTDWYNQHLIYANNGDKKSAEVCLSISAQLGCAEAQFRLARLLMDEGKEKLAEIWMIEAAKQGNAEYQYQLGRWYDYVFSHESREKCKSSAFIWYEKSAVQNHALAAKFLAQCYRLGNGCERDLSAAEYWYKKALELGEWVNRGLAEVYMETGRPELAVPLLSAEAAEGSIQARNILKGLQKNNLKHSKKMDQRCNALYKTLASCPIKVPQVTQLPKLHTTQIASKYFILPCNTLSTSILNVIFSFDSH